MCGIIGYTGKQEAVPIIIDGLRRLEYRGYDSAGVAAFVNGGIEVTRCKGKIRDLDLLVQGRNVESHTAVGHTRWATHGKPSEENAHPHRSGHVVVVHNGIIENYLDLKRELQAQGYEFTSETDTEVVAHLVNRESSAGGILLEEAVRRALAKVRGAYAVAVMHEREPGKIVGVRKDSPMVIGLGEGSYYLASDIPAFISHSRSVVFLNDGEMAILTPDGISYATLDGAPIKKTPTSIGWSAAMAEKSGYKHFMLKEIFEQPRAVADTLTGRVNVVTGEVNLEEFGLSNEIAKSIDRVVIVACGTSWHAGMVGKYYIEQCAKIPVEVDIASEYRYREPVVQKGQLFISITQSGETADTLAAMRLAKSLGARALTICNVIGSTASREADAVFYTRSGPEIGVASTKAFTTQLVALYLLAVALGHARGTISDAERKALMDELYTVPDKVEQALAEDAKIEAIAKAFHRNEAFLYLGRGLNFPIALEGALKLKEISYIHAQGYAAGEMKHGPIALIDEDYPVIFLAPHDALYEKVVSNVHEIKSRGGKVIFITTADNKEPGEMADHVVTVPTGHPFVMPILFSVPLQLVAYHIGVMRGCDVDQPRNLAKSVTVE